MPELTNRHHPFRYVTALTLLMKLGIDIHRVHIKAVGEHRNYLGEILGQEPAAGKTVDESTNVVLEVGFPSAVDWLPYQFFYGWRGAQAGVRVWEEDARHLMAPFDGSVIRYGAVATHEQLEYSLALVNLDYLLRYLKLFNFSLAEPPDDIREPLIWAAIMSGFHFWAGNPDFVARVLHALFGFDFRFVENVTAQYDIPNELQCRLGRKNSRAGGDFIVGRTFRECDSSYELLISGVKPDEVAALLPGKPKRRKIEWVLSICMPTNLDCRIRLKVDAGETRLGSSQGRSYLGLSSILHSRRATVRAEV